MTLGQKIKKARTEASLTQKELADQLCVTFQTISKWESDTNEPDLTTLRAIAKLTGTSLEYLVSEDDEPKPKEEAVEKPVAVVAPPPATPQKRLLGYCADCHRPLYEGAHFHNVERKSKSGVKETVMVCDPCFQKHEAETERRIKEIEDSMKKKPEETKGGIFHKITSRDDRKPLIWSIVLGVVALIVTLIICLVNYGAVGIGWTIAAPILIGYALMATIYCIFTSSFISDVFLSVASWSVHFPGLIFSWNLEGFMWLIAMKLLFFVLGIFIGIAVFTLALSIAAVLSVFSFIPLLVYNKTHYSKGE